MFVFKDVRTGPVRAHDAPTHLALVDAGVAMATPSLTPGAVQKIRDGAVAAAGARVQVGGDATARAGEKNATWARRLNFTARIDRDAASDATRRRARDRSDADG